MEKARTRRDGLATLAFWPDGHTFERTALFLDGMPYVPVLAPLSEFLVERGYGVIQPQYFGSFDSEGLLTPDAAVRTVFSVERQLHTQPWYDFRNEREFRPAPEIDVAAAHSYGTNVLFSALLGGFRPRVMILQSPFFLFGAGGETAGQRADFSGHVRQMVSALPLTFRFDSEETWTQFFVNGVQAHPPAERVEASERKTKLICVVGDKDADIDAARSREFVEHAARVYRHAFELAEYVVVPGAGHSQSALNTPDILSLVASYLL